MNVKNHTIYSDKMRLSVLNLTRIDLATEEDKACGLDKWAALFKAGTWEELKMLAQKNEFINEATSTIYQLSQEEQIRLQCEAREDYYRRQRSVQSMLEEQASTIKEQGDTIKAQDDAIKEKDDTIKVQGDAIKAQDDTIKRKDDEIARLRAEIESLKCGK